VLGEAGCWASEWGGAGQAWQGISPQGPCHEWGPWACMTITKAHRPQNAR
jgi:hypothetical protein